MVSLILICCEGRTEKEYLDILRQRVFRIPAYVRIRIEGQKGQHKALIDRVVALREDLAVDECLAEDEIECWAVCDDDGMKMTYSELNTYAESNGVQLAFSRPQFECYLIQHFEQSKITDQQSLYDGLTRYMNILGFEGSYSKADLAWLEKTLINKPKLVDTAIINANQRSTPSAPPFLTVQKLVVRLKQLSRS